MAFIFAILLLINVCQCMHTVAIRQSTPILKNKWIHKSVSKALFHYDPNLFKYVNQLTFKDATFPLNTVTLDNTNTKQYIAEIHLGSDYQNIKVIMDVGSSQAWVYEQEQCSEYGGCAKDIPRFQSKSSTTFVKGDISTKISYFQADQDDSQKGQVTGITGRDTFCFNDKKTSCEETMELGFIGHTTNMGDYSDASGIIGLAPNNTLPTNTGPAGFVHQLNEIITEINQPVFSIYFSTDQIYMGYFLIGGQGYDVAKYAKSGLDDSDIYWMENQPIISTETATLGEKQNYFWRVLIEQKSVRFLPKGEASQTTEAICNPKYGILNSRIQHIIMPEADLNKITAYLASEYSVTCENASPLQKFPSCDIDASKLKAIGQFQFAFTKFDDYADKNIIHFNMTVGDLFVLSSDSGQYNLLLESYKTTDEIFPGSAESDTWVIGLLYLKKYYTIFDRDNLRVGMIPPNPNAQSLDTELILEYAALITACFLILSGCCGCCCMGCKPCRAKYAVWKEQQEDKKYRFSNKLSFKVSNLDTERSNLSQDTKHYGSQNNRVWTSQVKNADDRIANRKDTLKSDVYGQSIDTNVQLDGTIGTNNSSVQAQQIAEMAAEAELRTSPRSNQGMSPSAANGKYNLASPTGADNEKALLQGSPRFKQNFE